MAKRIKGSHERLQQLAAEKGGVCLSTFFTVMGHNYSWKCQVGHIWSARAASIARGSWCPECSTGISERICRQYFEQLFAEKFPTSKPLWLKNGDGRLELDGYCENLRLAFEHQGIQHFSRSHFTYLAGSDDFEELQKRDALKEKLCEKNGVRLIKIPQLGSMLAVSNLREFIKTECLLQHLPIPDHFDAITIDLSKAHSPDSLVRLEELKALGTRLGGKCLSDVYLGANVSLLWECQDGHQWNARPSNIKTGYWCPKCGIITAGRELGSIELMQHLANQNGGKCLSTSYHRSDENLLWQCAKGHQWSAQPASIKNGSWCRFCASKQTGSLFKNTLQDMVRLATEKLGTCVSTEYINAKTKLEWKCADGHQWWASPAQITQGSWCPFCARRLNNERAKLTIDEMAEIAKERRGLCLSTCYVGANTKLEWRCEKGHQWHAEPSRVKHGSWCPFCVRANHGDKIRKTKALNKALNNT